MSHGAARTVSALTTNAIANAAFRMVEASVHDSSRSRVVMNSTKIGTKIVARISPSTSWYTMFGIWFARLYVSGSLDSTPPIAHAMIDKRRNPVTRDIAVPALITAVARASDVARALSLLLPGTMGGSP